MDKNNALFDEAYHRYKKAIDQIVRESQMNCEKVRRSYVAAVKDACESRATEQIVEIAYRNYMRALLEAWGAEETQQRTEQAHLGYLRTLQEAWQTDLGSRSIEEKQRAYERSLREALSPEVASKCLVAYHEYAQALNTMAESTTKQHATRRSMIHRF